MCERKFVHVFLFVAVVGRRATVPRGGGERTGWSGAASLRPRVVLVSLLASGAACARRALDRVKVVAVFDVFDVVVVVVVVQTCMTSNNNNIIKTSNINNNNTSVCGGEAVRRTLGGGSAAAG